MRPETLLFLTESIVGLALFSLGYEYWGSSWATGDPVALVVMGGVATFSPLVAVASLGFYDSLGRVPISRVVVRFGAVGLLSLAALTSSAVVMGHAAWMSWATRSLLLEIVGLCALRVVFTEALRRRARRGHHCRSLAVVGSGPRARAFVQEARANPAWGVRVEFILDEVEPALPLPAGEFRKLSDFPALLRDQVVDEVVLALPRSMLDRVAPVVAASVEVGVPVVFLSDLFGDYVPPPLVTRYGRFGALSFSPIHHSRLDFGCKRLIDLVGGALLLLIALPLMAAVAALVAATSTGPVVLRQLRCGLNGRPFTLLKFRTTHPGRLLRRSGLAALPQLWNVVRGEMSLVGPRPPRPAEVAGYEASTRRRLCMRPGITCLRQLSGYGDRAAGLDLDYIDRWSLLLDLEILLRTTGALLIRLGAR